MAVQEPPLGGFFDFYGAFAHLNIGNAHPVPLLDFVAALEAALNRKAVVESLEMQPGEVFVTHAKLDKLSSILARRSKSTCIQEGLHMFAKWFLEYEGYPSSKVVSSPN